MGNPDIGPVITENPEAVVPCNAIHRARCSIGMQISGAGNCRHGGSLLVLAHQGRVADDIRRQDRRYLARAMFRRHFPGP